MSDNVQTAMFEVLKKIQGDMAAFRAETADRFEKVDRRFASVEEILRKQRRGTAGLLVMANSVTGTFAEELAAVEERVTAPEAHMR